MNETELEGECWRKKAKVGWDICRIGRNYVPERVSRMDLWLGLVLVLKVLVCGDEWRKEGK